MIRSIEKAHEEVEVVLDVVDSDIDEESPAYAEDVLHDFLVDECRCVLNRLDLPVVHVVDRERDIFVRSGRRDRHRVRGIPV